MAAPRLIDPTIRDWLRAQVDADSLRVVACRYALAETTIARVLAALPVSGGTASILDVAYRRRNAA